MSEELKRRLVGAGVLLATFSIIAWWVGSRDEQSSGSQQTNAQIRNYDIRELDRIAAAQQVPEEVPVTDPEPIKQEAPEPEPVAEPVVKEDVATPDEEAKAPKPAPIKAEVPKPAPKPVDEPVRKSEPVSAQQPDALPATDASGEWIVQVSSVTNKSSAQALADRLQSKGWNSFLTNAVVNEKTYYRVRVGPYAKRESADNAASNLTKELDQAVAVMKQ